MTMIETSRALLRRFELEDLNNLITLETDPEILKYITDGKVYTKEEVKARLEKIIAEAPGLEPLGIWAAEFHDTEEFIGWFMLRYYDRFKEPELGFMIAKKHWRKGLTKEIADALIQFAKYKKLPTLVAITHPDHTASMKLLEKLGFKFVEATKVHNATLGKEVAANLYRLDLA